MRSKYKLKSSKNFLFLVVLILFVIFISLLFINNKNKSKFKTPDINLNIYNDKNEEKIQNINDMHKDTVVLNSSITIPAIFLNDAPIKEGVEQDTLEGYVGHFPTTSNLDGNIGLAAHNRGYKINYFSNIHKLNIGDEVIYKLGDNVRKYKVDKKLEIDSYDWGYLNSTNDNRITLITCVDNEPNKRLVVQAIE